MLFFLSNQILKEVVTLLLEMKSSKTQLSVLWLLVCLQGNGFQVYHLSKQYFSYEINTNVRQAHDNVIQMPSVTLCFEAVSLIKWTKLKKKNVETLIEGVISEELFNGDSLINLSAIKKLPITDRMAVLGNLFRNFPLNVIINNMTMEAKDIFDPTMIFGYEKDKNTYIAKPGGLHLYYNISSFIRDMHKCFLLVIRDEYISDVKYFNLKRQPVSPYLVNILGIMEDVLDIVLDVLYMLSPKNSLPYAGFPPYLEKAVAKNKVYFLSYDELEEDLLPPPFETKCRDYNTPDSAGHSYQSQSDCYEKCFRNQSLETTGSLLPGLVLDSNDNYTVVPVFDLVNRMTSITHLKTGESLLVANHYNQISLKCMKKCSQFDCHIKTFIPKTTGLLQRKDELLQILNFQVRQTPLTYTRYLQQYSLAQFLVDIASSFGFWLGMTAFGANRGLQKAYEKVSQLLTKPIWERNLLRRPWKTSKTSQCNITKVTPRRLQNCDQSLTLPSLKQKDKGSRKVIGRISKTIVIPP